MRKISDFIKQLYEDPKRSLNREVHKNEEVTAANILSNRTERMNIERWGGMRNKSSGVVEVAVDERGKII